MIDWKRENVYLILCLFGDGIDHQWGEVVNLGTRLFLKAPINGRHKTHQAKFEEFFAKAVNYGLVDKVETPYLRTIHAQKTYQIGKEDYMYKISAKGDRLLRQEGAERTGEGFYYNLFDRDINSSNGIDRFAPLPGGLRKVKNGMQR